MGRTQRVPPSMLEVAIQIRISLLQISVARLLPFLAPVQHNCGDSDGVAVIPIEHLGVRLLDADLRDDGWKTRLAQSRVRVERLRQAHRELAFLPLAQQQVIESSVIVVKTILDGLENSKRKGTTTNTQSCLKKGTQMG